MMGGNKHGSRSGRYVGSLLHLFDWNTKSRKKLCSSKSNLQEQSKRGTRSTENFPITRIRLEDEEFGAAASIRGASDYSCASSVTDDDVYGMKAPGVVARLMGLDSLPVSNALEPCATSFFETRSLGDASFRRKDVDLYPNHQILNSTHPLDEVRSSSRRALDMRPQKMPNRPIEKFQTEILPPKSSKTIPITHHKLLSPIKTPIFVLSRDADHIMEAAAKIIVPGVRQSLRKRISSVGSSSVPLKVRELKEKLEASQRPAKATETSESLVEAKATKHHRGQSVRKSLKGSLNASSSYRVSPNADESYGALNDKRKSISLAIQAKVNVQRREGLSTSSRSLGGREEQETKSIRSVDSQSYGSKTANKRSSTQSTSSVLRQSNQKQNCSSHREKLASKTSITILTGKRPVSDDMSNRRQKNLDEDMGTYRIASRKSRLQARDGGDKDFPYPGVRNVPRKKRSIDTNGFHRNQVTDKMLHGKFEKQPNHDPTSDVISFTFSAPITRSLLSSEPARQLGEKSGNLFLGDREKKLLGPDYTMLSLPGFSGVGSEALSFLLEKKLKELTSSFETSDQNLDERGLASSECGMWKGRGKKAKQEMQANNLNPEQLRLQKHFQAAEAMADYGSIKDGSKLWNDFRVPSPVSILEPSVLTESWNSSESTPSSIAEESKPCSSIQAQGVLGSSSSKKRHSMETETDVSDSASSTSSQISSAKDPMKKPTSWELAYIQDILCNVVLMFKNYTTGKTAKLVNPNLFDHLERRQGGLKRREDMSRLERKVLFDGVSECLDLKCERFVYGGFELWAKGIATMKRKERLAEEVLKEIQGWRSQGKSMVDALVDKDMSSKYGRWVDFEVDEFTVGVEIEGQILDSLVLEILSDILPCNLCSY